MLQLIRSLKRGLRPLGLVGLLLLAQAAQAQFDWRGEKSVYAIAADGERTLIARLQLTPVSPQLSRFQLTLNTEVLRDYFLSMREFKCLPAAKEITCYVPYPYAHPGTAGPGQTAWLEHNLLMLVKSPSEFGAKLWNGVYFALSERGASLVGTPQAVDLNEIAAPPAKPEQAPFGPARRHEIAPGARWISSILIE